MLTDRVIFELLLMQIRKKVKKVSVFFKDFPGFIILVLCPEDIHNRNVYNKHKICSL